MKPARSARPLLVLAAVGLLALSLAGYQSGPPPSEEIDQAALASARTIQERFEEAVRSAVVSAPTLTAPLDSGPHAPEGDFDNFGGFGDLRTYIVTLRDQLRPQARAFAEGTGGKVVHVYDQALAGFAVELVPEAAEALRRIDQVLRVEEDVPVQIDAQTTPTGVNRVADPDVASASIANLAINGIDDTRVGAGIAVLDTGIASHSDLDVVSRTDCTGSFCSNGQGFDGNGHGTHVAGIAAAIDNGFGVVGVAPGADLYSVKVLGNDGRGYFSDVIAGIDWATARAGAIDVINLSLTGNGFLFSLNQAIDSATAAGIVVVAAAGNASSGRQDVIPANHPDVLAVSALADTDGVSGGTGGYCSGFDDRLAAFSNYGAFVDVAAPGTCIYSTLPGGYGSKSGTSMAAPHVAGAAALLAANGQSRSAIRSTILSQGNFNWVDTSGDGIKEPLLDVSGSAFRVAGAPVPPTTTTTPSTTTTSTSTTTTTTSTSTTTTTPSTTTTSTSTTTTTVPTGGNQPPVAVIDADCRRLGCSFDGRGSSDADGTVVSYQWDFGDGTTDSGSRVRHIYDDAGTFTLTLTVVDNNGAAANTSLTLTCVGSGFRVSCS